MAVTRKDTELELAVYLFNRDSTFLIVNGIKDFSSLPKISRENYFKDSQEVLTILKGWKSPEEFFNESMAAKKSGWNDCAAYYKAENKELSRGGKEL